MPEKLEKEFEKEYMKKGKTKKEADLIFYKWENKHRKGDKTKQKYNGKKKNKKRNEK